MAFCAWERDAIRAKTSKNILFIFVIINAHYTAIIMPFFERKIKSKSNSKVNHRWEKTKQPNNLITNKLHL